MFGAEQTRTMPVVAAWIKTAFDPAAPHVAVAVPLAAADFQQSQFELLASGDDAVRTASTTAVMGVIAATVIETSREAPTGSDALAHSITAIFSSVASLHVAVIVLAEAQTALVPVVAA